MTPETIELLPLDIRAAVGEVNESDRTVDLVFSTGAGVVRYDYRTGTKYLEKLSLKDGHVRLDRLNAGAPLLDAHSGYSVRHQYGVTVDGSARVTGREGRVKVRFSKREEAEPIFQDVRDKIIRSVSVGYLVHKYEETTGKDGAMPVRTAIDWEPYEISMVPIPADAGARFRAQQPPLDTYPCVVITRQEPAMNEEQTRSETLVERDPLDPGAPAQRAAETPAEPNEHDAGVKAEQARIQGILLACRSARLPQATADKFIADNTPLVEAQTRIFEELRQRDLATVPRGASSGPSVIVGEDTHLVHIRKGIENALMHRISPELFKLEDVGRQYRGMTLLEVAGTFLRAQGVRTTGLSKLELAGRALGLDTRGGMHTSADFPLLLADVTGKTLRRAYEEAPATFKAIGRQTTLPDFKPAKRLQLGEAPQLKKILEHGEYTRGSIGEGKEEYQLATYGRVFAITRKTLINDDTDAFSRVPMLFGRSARDLESDLVWEQITAPGSANGPTMSDGVALFNAAHGNLAGSGAAIGVDSIGLGRAAMRKQKGLDGKQRLNLVPRVLIVTPTKETIADQFVSVNLLASQSSQVNPFAGKLTVVAEPRLEDVSANHWFLAASTDQIDMVEYAFLEGENGPAIESRIGFDVDGLEVKCRHDFAAKVIDYRGLYRNPGA